MAHKRAIVRELAEAYPVNLVCIVLDLPRSTYYYAPEPPDDAVVKAAITEIAGRWPTYGYRRITAQLRRGVNFRPEMGH